MSGLIWFIIGVGVGILSRFFNFKALFEAIQNLRGGGNG